MTGAELMARPKGRPKQKGPDDAAPNPRITIINLKGTQEQADWLNGLHRKSLISKTNIIRQALQVWAE